MNKSFHRTTNNYNTPVKTGTQSQQGLQQLPQATNNDRPKTPTNKTATTKWSRKQKSQALLKTTKQQLINTRGSA
jgi:hypothetical protein